MRRSGLPVRSSASGFTLFELLVVIAVFSIMAVATTVSIRQPQTDASVEAATSALIADIKSQQLLAMVGDGGSDGVDEPYGIFIQSNQYTLFKNSSYVAGDADNFVVSNATGISLSTTFPSTQVVFAQASGDVNGFTAGSNTITITNTIISRTITLTLNRYGAITQT